MRRRGRWWAGLAVSWALSGCVPVFLGARFPADARAQIVPGHDREPDVLRKLGAPLRRQVDPDGRQVLTYFWADGAGEGSRCVVGLNKNGVVYAIEVDP